MSLLDQMSGKQKAGLGAGALVLVLGLGWIGAQGASTDDGVKVEVEPQVESSNPRVHVSKDSESQLLSIYVSGAVVRPGVYELDSTKIVRDAVFMAGGPVEGADMDGINLAGRLIDHMQVQVPWVEGNLYNGEGDVPIAPSLISINTATKESLMNLPNIGEKTAERIIQYREENGGFSTVEDLRNVEGIGEKTLEKLRGRITL